MEALMETPSQIRTARPSADLPSVRDRSPRALVIKPYRFLFLLWYGRPRLDLRRCHYIDFHPDRSQPRNLLSMAMLKKSQIAMVLDGQA
jgi:hypothetical protein